MRKLAVLLLLAACATQPAQPRLETTPRHDEWVTIDSAGRTLHAYVVYPQSSKKTGAVMVIHENRGLTDWVRTVADQLAERGYLAIAPDLLSGSAPNGGRTSDFATSDAAREAISKLPREQVLADLAATAKYVRAIPSANGKLAVMGFCWGGARTWDSANTIDNLAVAMPFYGTGPSTDEGVTGIEAPVYGFYGGDDARVNATIDPSKALMDKHGKKFEPVIYPGAGHAFMRLGEEANATEANKTARDEAWKRLLVLLRAVD
ncbi:MAG TPA: dienelactone hydrolase family protein [Thermoanaerobaculia bacterium]|jgi:carboxymethylenebutenolidase|nr:dienelactone hydrolase family protein [Thermoanaerobaculia bacterium]